jgi:hypothetical protein
MTTVQDVYQDLPNPFLPSEIQLPEEEDRFKVFLKDTLQKITDVANEKTIGVYLPTESFNGELWNYINPMDPPKNGYRIIYFTPSLPATGVSVVPIPGVIAIQGLNANFMITLCYGSASRPATTPGAGDYFSFMSSGDSRISFTISDQALTITTTVDLSAYKGVFVLEYIKNS